MLTPKRRHEEEAEDAERHKWFLYSETDGFKMNFYIDSGDLLSEHTKLLMRSRWRWRRELRADGSRGTHHGKVLTEVANPVQTGGDDQAKEQTNSAGATHETEI